MRLKISLIESCIDALIISLPSSQARQDFQHSQMTRLGLKYQIVSATDSAFLPENIYRSLSKTWERPLKKVEVSCFLSHQKAWEIVYDTNKPLLILEDDALLSNVTSELLLAVAHTKNMDLLTLEVRGRKKIVSKLATPLTDKMNVLELFQDRTGAAGYILWPSGAKKLLNKAKSGKIGLADAFISSNYDLHAFQIEPAVVVQLDMCEHYGLTSPLLTTSSIGGTEKPLAGTRKIIFLYRRLKSQFLMAYRILSVLHKADRRYIMLQSKYFHD